MCGTGIVIVVLDPELFMVASAQSWKKKHRPVCIRWVGTQAAAERPLLIEPSAMPVHLPLRDWFYIILAHGWMRVSGFHVVNAVVVVPLVACAIFGGSGCSDSLNPGLREIWR